MCRERRTAVAFPVLAYFGDVLSTVSSLADTTVRLRICRARGIGVIRHDIYRTSVDSVTL